MSKSYCSRSRICSRWTMQLRRRSPWNGQWQRLLLLRARRCVQLEHKAWLCRHCRRVHFRSIASGSTSSSRRSSRARCVLHATSRIISSVHLHLLHSVHFAVLAVVNYRRSVERRPASKRVPSASSMWTKIICASLCACLMKYLYI